MLPAGAKRMNSGGLAWGAGIVNHGGFDDLEACLDSLRRQTRPPVSVVVWDTGLDNDRLEEVESTYREVRFLRGANLGYAGGANRVLGELQLWPDPMDFLLVLNPDVILDGDCAERMLERLASEPL